MLDINKIVNETKYVHDALTKKGFDVDFAPLIDMYNQRKQLIVKAEDLKKEKNQLSASVPVIKKQGGNVEEIFAKVKEPNKELTVLYY